MVDKTPQGPPTPPDGQKPINVVTEFEAVTDHFKQDIREFFTRSNFYLAVHVALLSVVGIRAPKMPLDDVVTIIISLAGLVLTVFWWCVSFGSVWWIDRWREEVRRLSRDYSDTQSYEEIEKGTELYHYRSPERVTMYLPFVFGIIWLILAVATLSKLLKLY